MGDSVNVAVGILWWLCGKGVCARMIVSCLAIFLIWDGGG